MMTKNSFIIRIYSFINNNNVNFTLRYGFLELCEFFRDSDNVCLLFFVIFRP